MCNTLWHFPSHVGCVVANCWRDIKIRTRRCARWRTTDVCDNGFFNGMILMPLVSFCTNMINIWWLRKRSTDILAVCLCSDMLVYECVGVWNLRRWSMKYVVYESVWLVNICFSDMNECYNLGILNKNFDTKQEKMQSQILLNSVNKRCKKRLSDTNLLKCCSPRCRNLIFSLLCDFFFNMAECFATNLPVFLSVLFWSIYPYFLICREAES